MKLQLSKGRQFREDTVTSALYVVGTFENACCMEHINFISVQTQKAKVPSLEPLLKSVSFLRK